MFEHLSRAVAVVCLERRVTFTLEVAHDDFSHDRLVIDD